MSQQNKVAVVTGGANGIGRCITEELLKAGAAVACIDTDPEAGNLLAGRYGAERLFFYQGDIAERSVIEDFTAQVTGRFGQVDYLINNACISKKGLLTGCSYDDFEYVQRIGVTAPYYLTLRLKEYFAQGASIVNISSSRERMSQPDTESYTAAKGGIGSLTHALSVSLAGKVRVNAVSPGWIDTAAYHGTGEAGTPVHSEADRLQHPAGRVGTPTDIAAMVLFLCSDAAGFITGENITIDGGMGKQMIYHGDEGWTFLPGGQL
ncbi:SDR family oxidoreductase [Paenibacillus sp. MMS20-IR301]|uniref:SDR family oxidoreductase n=1 Tax=Paenibacillus sp. MMS20-IR301 TaxID=2895946 RepID=UPI0028EF7CFB|nr:SDR family oxidoreductase [Paenibacillus sp. MMS20-IR301]WNS46130.1 SDR family oxidoreductase [Paenibacillus sp. MMS20-IR301]